MDNALERIISVTELRRNFGEITANLAEVDSFILTRGGEPFAVLKAVPEEKKKVLMRAAGAWEGTTLDDDALWEKSLKRKSRKTAINL